MGYKAHSIPTLPTAKLATIKAKNFYLFSIINPCIIPKSFLQEKKIILALNYHDSPLPKYAGVNSTTWAIINNEKSHGVTLHQITPGIDDGDLVGQSLVNLSQDETAISLNLKCSESLLSLFQEVLAKIDAGTLKFSKQNLSNRTYYGTKNIPTNYGIINGNKDLKKLSRLIRGLTFGQDYDNPEATVKVALNGKFYIGEEFNQELIQNSRTDYKPDKNLLLFNSVKDLYGHKTDCRIEYQDLATPFNLNQDELQYLAEIKSRERKYKQPLLKVLRDPDISIRVLDRASTVSPDRDHQHLPKKRANSADRNSR